MDLVRPPLDPAVPQALRDQLAAATEAVIHFEHEIRRLEGKLKEAKASRGQHKQRLDALLKRCRPLPKKEPK